MTYIGSVDSPTPEWAKWIDKRDRLKDLYVDPDWLLQAGLGDVEFEQDLYDAFRYSPEVGGLTDYNYNALSLKALRDFSEDTGPRRYLDETPFSEEIFGFIEPPRELLDWEGKDVMELLEMSDEEQVAYDAKWKAHQQAWKDWSGMRDQKITEIADYMNVDPSSLLEGYENEDIGDLSTLGFYTGHRPMKDRHIDMNLRNTEKLLNYYKGQDPRWRNPHADPSSIEKDYSLRDTIFDLYGHELPHHLDFNRFPGKEKRRVLKKGPDHFEHPAIYLNTGIYGLSNAMKKQGMERWKEPPWGRMTVDEGKTIDALNYPLEYFGRSKQDEIRRYPQDTFYEDYPYAGHSVAQGYVPNRDIGPVGAPADITRGPSVGPPGSEQFPHGGW